MKSPKISIVVPVYNGEKTLQECLKSIINQTYKNYEVLVVDNNCNDRTKEIINEFKKKNKRVKYVFEARISRGAARNTGEKKAKGSIILMTDSDCIVPRNWIREMVEPILKGETAVQGIKKSINKNYWTSHVEEEKKRITKQRLKDKKIGLLDTANFLIKKNILKKVGYSNPIMENCNDTELEVRLKLQKIPVLLKKTAVIHYEPDSPKNIFLKFFDRGKWNEVIVNTYKDKKNMLPDYGIKFYLYYVFGLSFRLITLNKNFPYDLITGIGWRAGIIFRKFRSLFYKE